MITFWTLSCNIQTGWLVEHEAEVNHQKAAQEDEGWCALPPEDLLAVDSAYHQVLDNTGEQTGVFFKVVVGIDLSMFGCLYTKVLIARNSRKNGKRAL